LNIPFNIILPSMPGFSKESVPLAFPHQKPVHLLCPVCTVPHSPAISFFFICSPAYYLVRTKHGLSLCGLLRCPVTTSPLGPHIFPQHPTLEHNFLPLM